MSRTDPSTAGSWMPMSFATGGAMSMRRIRSIVVAFTPGPLPMEPGESCVGGLLRLRVLRKDRHRPAVSVPESPPARDLALLVELDEARLREENVRSDRLLHVGEAVVAADHEKRLLADPRLLRGLDEAAHV